MEKDTEEIVEELENGNMEEENNEISEDANKEECNGKLQQKLDDTTDTLKRVMADYENYKKRNERERELLYKSILGDIVSSLLPIIDNLEKAVEATTEDANYKQGVELVFKQFTNVLGAFGVEVIETKGESFNPEFHEAVSSVEDDTLGEQIIKEEVRKGYKTGSKVIRHAMVVVAN